VFLDAAQRKWIEELGGMNVFFVLDDESLRTPPLSGTILPVITRASIIEPNRFAPSTPAYSAARSPIRSAGSSTSLERFA